MAFNLSSSLLQVAHISSKPRLQRKALAAASSRRPFGRKAESPAHLRSTPSLPLRPTGRSFRCSSSSNDRGDEDQAVTEVQRPLEENRRAELAARIASGEFTVQQPGSVALLLFSFVNLFFSELVMDLDLSSQEKVGSCAEEWAFDSGAAARVLGAAVLEMGLQRQR